MKFWIVLAGSFLAFATNCFAQGGPPLIGDDPGTPGNGKWEINVSANYVQTDNATSLDVPYLDINYGLGDHIQINYQGGLLFGKNNGQGWQNGWDDSLIGLKWRFLDQEDRGVDMSIYPQLGFNTTSSFAHVGLNEAGATFYMPMEIARTFGPLELDGEVGFQYYEHDRDQWAGSIIIGYMITEHIELLAESRLVCDYAFRSTDVILDGGGRIDLAEHVQLLIAAGRGLRNGYDSPHVYAYVGLGFRF